MLKMENDRLKEDIRIVQKRAKDEIKREQNSADEKIAEFKRKHNVEMK